MHLFSPRFQGQAFINGFNLGRYWPLRGPQVRLYIPKPIFNPYPTANHLYLLELENYPCHEYGGNGDSVCQVTLRDTPYLNAPNHSDGPVDLDVDIKEKDPLDNDPSLHLVH